MNLLDLAREAIADLPDPSQHREATPEQAGELHEGWLRCCSATTRRRTRRRPWRRRSPILMRRLQAFVYWQPTRRNGRATRHSLGGHDGEV